MCNVQCAVLSAEGVATKEERAKIKGSRSAGSQSYCRLYRPAFSQQRPQHRSLDYSKQKPAVQQTKTYGNHYVPCLQCFNYNRWKSASNSPGINHRFFVAGSSPLITEPFGQFEYTKILKKFQESGSS